MKSHFLAQTHNHTRWNRDLPPALEIESGDSVEMELRDSSDGQVKPDWTTARLAQLDRNRIHALTGPIFIKGARPGDSLEIVIESIEHHGWGWTSLIPGLGLLPERFPDFFLHIWQLDQASTTLGPATIPLHPFCGIMGVAPEEPGEHRTRPPGRFGGNLDVRQLSAGARLYLPVCVEGGLFSAGDTHAAQGDGEVCINGIEMPRERPLYFYPAHGSPSPRTVGGSASRDAPGCRLMGLYRVPDGILAGGQMCRRTSHRLHHQTLRNQSRTCLHSLQHHAGSEGEPVRESTDDYTLRPPAEKHPSLQLILAR